MRKHTCQIYVLFDKRGIVNYVGRTRRKIELRMSEHKQVLGFKPTFRIIAYCSSDCRQVERKWIDYYRERGFTLRNINYGQGPHFLPESSRRKLSLAFKGRPVTWGAKISLAQKGIPKKWSPLGKLRVQVTQFKSGECRWNRLTPKQQEEKRRRARERWNDPKRAAKMRAGLKLGSAWRTPEERVAVGVKISAAQKGNPKIIARAKLGASATLRRHPDQMSKNIKKFWRELKADPERYRTYLERRGRAISEAKRKVSA